MVHNQFHAYLNIMCDWCELNLGNTSKDSLVTPPLPFNMDHMTQWHNGNIITGTVGLSLGE